jgi:Cysteine synthase
MNDNSEFSALRFDQPGRGRIYDSIVETMGNTPLVRVRRLCAAEGIKADVLLKLEFFNPLASVKDRIGVNMILALEQQGKIKPGSTLIEPTSGNTGIALAFVGAARGYRVILTMPDSMSIERRKMLVFLGAELHLTPARAGHEGRDGTGAGTTQGYSRLGDARAVHNPANPEVHRKTTAEEIWRDTAVRST